MLQKLPILLNLFTLIKNFDFKLIILIKAIF